MGHTVTVDLAAEQAATSCPPMIQFATTGPDVAIHFDSVLGATQVYVGDYFNDRVVRHDVTTALVHTETPLPVSYGLPWVVADLDRDGQMELVIQRGDQGLGGNGYLDILSAPDWHLRTRFVFPGMKTVMHAVAVDLNADSSLELYLTPQDFGGTARAVVIDYDSGADSFAVVANIPTPFGTGGTSAVADFDGDGRMEFLTGSDRGYGLFEWQGNALTYIGKVGDTSDGGHLCAVACRPKPGGQLHALLGHSYGQGGFQFELMAATGDNTFERTHLFAETTGWIGITPCAVADIDCDGLVSCPRSTVARKAESRGPAASASLCETMGSGAVA